MVKHTQKSFQGTARVANQARDQREQALRELETSFRRRMDAVYLEQQGMTMEERFVELTQLSQVYQLARNEIDRMHPPPVMQQEQEGGERDQATEATEANGGGRALAEPDSSGNQEEEVK